MPFTTSAFDRRLAALERAEAGRFGRPLADNTFARVALARRLAAPEPARSLEPAELSAGPALLLQR
jgi:hypothetical protein